MTSKNLITKTLCFVIILITVSFFCCDGSSYKKRTSAQVLQENGLLATFSERIIYVPEAYAETHIDTILTSGFQVNIKTFVDMESTFLIEGGNNQSHTKTFYRNLKADVLVLKNDIPIFDKTISKVFINEVASNKNSGLENFILKQVWIDDEFPNNTQTILINILYCQATDASFCKTFQLEINNNGTFHLKAIKNKL